MKQLTTVKILPMGNRSCAGAKKYNFPPTFQFFPAVLIINKDRLTEENVQSLLWPYVSGVL